jgi:hypothetical protein
MEPVPGHVLARLMRSAAMIDGKATVPIEAGLVVRMVMELEERRDAEKRDPGQKP